MGLRLSGRSSRQQPRLLGGLDAYSHRSPAGRLITATNVVNQTCSTTVKCGQLFSHLSRLRSTLAVSAVLMACLTWRTTVPSDSNHWYKWGVSAARKFKESNKFCIPTPITFSFTPSTIQVRKLATLLNISGILTFPSPIRPMSQYVGIPPWCMARLRSRNAAWRHRPLAGTNVYCLVTEAHVCE